MKLETMRYEKDGKIARLTLNRPEKLNAMNYEGVLELKKAVEAIGNDPDTRMVLIKGAGRAFCSGIDLKELSAGETPAAYFELWDRALRLLERMEKVVLCAMHGYALGGGLQLALASDIRIATPDCSLGLPAIRESIIPGLATLRLPRYVGLGRARWMVLSGENVTGLRALEIGLVDHVVDSDSFDDGVEALVAKYIRICSEGTRQSKVMLALSGEMTHDQFFEEYLRRQAIALVSPDHEEARKAYLDNRDPEWA